jgi:peptidyl-prolyl isomerase G (cyclophilin G)
MARKRNPLVFLDVSIGDEQDERMVFEVFLFLLPFLYSIIAGL